jgi:predicted transcriptional regulator
MRLSDEFSTGVTLVITEICKKELITCIKTGNYIDYYCIVLVAMSRCRLRSCPKIYHYDSKTHSLN